MQSATRSQTQPGLAFARRVVHQFIAISGLLDPEFDWKQFLIRLLWEQIAGRCNGTAKLLHLLNWKCRNSRLDSSLAHGSCGRWKPGGAALPAPVY